MRPQDQSATVTGRRRRGAPVLLAAATAVGLWFGFGAADVSPVPVRPPAAADPAATGAADGGGRGAVASDLAGGAAGVLGIPDPGAPGPGGRERRRGGGR